MKRRTRVGATWKKNERSETFGDLFSPLCTVMNPQRSRNYISYFSKYPEKDIDSTLVNHKLITTGYLFHIYMIIVLYYLFIFIFFIFIELLRIFKFFTKLRWGASVEGGLSEEHLREVELDYICNRDCRRHFKLVKIFRSPP